jgi:hypothetical protein
MVEMLHNSQAPAALVAMSFIAAMAASLQPIIDVCLPIGNTVPVSMYSLLIAESGERKSFVDRPIAQAIFDFDQYQDEKHGAALIAYQAKIRAWEAIERALVNRICTAAMENKPLDALEQQLQAHTATKPAKPRRRQISRLDISPTALVEALEGDGESIAFLCGEGGMFVNGGALNQVDLLNECWSGVQSLSRDRANGRRRVVRNPRVTIAFMVPDGVLKDYEKRRGRVLRGSGHWARYLVAKPVSTQGWRELYSTDLVWTHLPKFQSHIRKLLDEYARRAENGEVKRTTLHFGPEAKHRWRDAAKWVESQLQPSAYLSDMRDFSSKVMEIAARLAALLHCYAIDAEQVIAGDIGEISLSTLENALQIAEWHLHEYKRIFAPQSLITQVQVDVQRLEQYLYRELWRNGIPYIQKNIVRQFGPLRNKMQLDTALDMLESLGCVWVSLAKDRKKYIHLNPIYFNKRSNAMQ